MSDYVDIDTGQPLTDDELHARFDDMLDECCEEVRIGDLTYSPSRVLGMVDPIAYACGFNDWVDGELGETIADAGRVECARCPSEVHP